VPSKSGPGLKIALAIVWTVPGIRVWFKPVVG